jgi:hypothetical protein
VQLYASQEKPQIALPEPAAIPQGVIDIKTQGNVFWMVTSYRKFMYSSVAPGLTPNQSGPDMRMQKEMLPKKDWVILQNLVETFPQPEDRGSDMEYGTPGHRPPTYYSTARSARSAGKQQGL